MSTTSPELKPIVSGLRYLAKWENMSKTIVYLIFAIVAVVAYYYSNGYKIENNSIRITTLENEKSNYATKAELKAVTDNAGKDMENLQKDIEEIKQQNAQIYNYLLNQKTGK